MDGQTFVVTGVFERLTRDKIEEFIKTLGGRVTGSVSGKTSYLIAGHQLEDGRETSTSKKYITAHDRGVSILTEDEFEEMIRKKINKPAFVLENYRNWKGAPVEEEEKVRPSVAPSYPTDGNSADTELWVDRYRPRCATDLVGNQGVID